MTALLTNERPAAQVLSLDYPRQNEKVTSPDYTFRISAPEDAKSVEVAVNQGPWQPCRKAAGHWWYDWSGYGSGEHEVVTRMKTPRGLRITAEQHEFFVAL